MKIKFIGLKKVMGGIKSMLSSSSKLKPVWKKIRKNYQDIETKTFRDEGRASNWAPLNSKYAAYKLKKYGNKKILRLSGELRKSLVGDTRYTIKKIKSKSMEVGTNLSYAKYHQEGTSKMPARPPLDFKSSDYKQWTKMIQNYIIRRFEGRA